MKKKIVLVALAVMALGLMGCAESSTEDADMVAESTEDVQIEIEKVEPTVSVEPTKEVKKRKMYKVAVVGEPAISILKKADSVMEVTDYGIEAVVCDNYTTPNEMVMAGEADACLCDNQVFLESYNKVHDSDLVIAERIYSDPLAIFPGTVTDMNFVGSNIKVAVAKGDVNVARALYLLEQKGLVEVIDSALYQATMDDVTDNPYNISIEEFDADSPWPDSSKYGMFICDYNRAALAGIDPESSIGEENRNSEIFNLFSVCLVVKEGRLDDSSTGEMLKYINSDEVEDFIAENYYNSVLDYK